MKKEKINGAEALLRTIEAEGIDTIFGYPGGTIIPIYDKLYDWPGNLKHILVRHEQGAVHAAEGYARSTGKVGVCIATAGPGATNFITGIADAMMDSTPVICITAQVNADKLGTNFFQETDMIGITIPITKWNRQITSVHEIPAVMAQAFHIARSGRPGPVVISLTKNAQVEMVEYVFNPGKAIRELGLRKVTSREKRITSENIKRATELLNSSRKPLIIAGQGINISLAWKELEELAVQGNIPVATTLLGLGCINSNHPLNVGMVGMHGNIAPNSMTQQADVILAVGMRFSDRVTGDIKGYAPRARIIHIDIDRSEFGKNIKAGIKIQADAREVLTQLCQGIQYRDRQEWLDFAKEKKELERQKIFVPQLSKDDGPLKMAQVIEAISRHAGQERIIVSDVGQNQMFCARYSRFERRRGWITSGGLGTMGFGLPAAVGVAAGNPHSTVIAVMGDGGFQMNIQELGTLLQSGLTVKMVLLNNSYLGMVRQWQDLFFKKRYSATHLINPDFQMLMKAYHIPSSKVATHGELDEKIKEMVTAKGSFFLEAIVRQEENVFPMIPADRTLDDIIYENEKIHHHGNR